MTTLFICLFILVVQTKIVDGKFRDKVEKLLSKAASVASMVKSPKKLVARGAAELAKAAVVERALQGAVDGYNAAKEKISSAVDKYETKRRERKEMRRIWDQEAATYDGVPNKDSFNDPRQQNQHIKDHFSATHASDGRPTAMRATSSGSRNYASNSRDGGYSGGSSSPGWG